MSAPATSDKALILALGDRHYYLSRFTFPNTRTYYYVFRKESDGSWTRIARFYCDVDAERFIDFLKAGGSCR